jgi:hypothetical protein
MAKVRLQSYDGRVRDLPSLCMRCGAPSSLLRYRSFSWHPGWVAILLLVGLLPYVIVALVLTKRARVDVPLCDKHKNHWLWRLLFLLGCPLLIGGGGVILAIALSSLEGPPKDASGWVCAGCGLLFVFWLIAAAIIESLSIRPVQITDRTISLSGVSKDFVQAYKEELAAWENEVDEAALERWNDRTRPRSDQVRRRPRDSEEDRPDTYGEMDR